uniref:Uncharacterized protein n=1 Tax=Arundo donax TaxID=35708 RepID=A0A0A9CBK6_ARUDO
MVSCAVHESTSSSRGRSMVNNHLLVSSSMRDKTSRDA